jgi:serine/threonine protein phosphatase PrpC
MTPILLSVAGNPENQDRGLIVPDGPRTALCVADGAGGRSGGTEAAVLAIEFIRQNAAQLSTSEACVDLLRQMDAAISKDPVAGETTFALAVVAQGEIYGASVGDSGIWLIPPSGDLIDLTARQQRKPFIGSGSAWPVGFQQRDPQGILLLATDGLLKYTSAARIVETCRQNPPNTAAQQLIELVKYPSGNFPDDVTVILASL